MTSSVSRHQLLPSKPYNYIDSHLSLFILAMTAPEDQSSHLPNYIQAQNLTDECRQLLLSLPSENGWLSPFVHLYQGFWHKTCFMDGVLSTQRNFKALDSDVLLITTPKSGTTWLKALLFALINRPSYSTSSNHPLLTKSPHELVPFLEINLYDHNHDPDLSSLTSPRLFSTHLSLGSLPESVVSSKCKLVYLCRNPKDTFVSLWHFMNQLRLGDNLGANQMEEAFEMFCRGVSAFGPFWDHVLGYYKASLEMPNKVMFLKYEDMKERPVEELRRVAGFLGCPFSETQDEPVNEILRLCSFDSLSRLEVNQNGKLNHGADKKFFFRKGEVGDWINILSPEMAERLDRITEERFGSFGLKL